MTDAAPRYPGLLLIISGPSGAGKTTIARRVEKALGGRFSVSATTRPPGPGEADGRDYHFLSQGEFLRRRDAGELLEWAEVFGNHYGTPREPVLETLRQGGLMILEIDIEGALQVKRRLPEALAIFIEPPDEVALLARLRSRKREAEEVIQRRFARAKAEIARAHACGAYDHFVVNEDLERAVDRTLTLVRQALGQRSGRV